MRESLIGGNMRIIKIFLVGLFTVMLSANVLAAGQQAADGGAELILEGMDGKTYKLSDYRGKWVVLNYWASWCPPCLEEMPELVDFHDAHHEKDAVVWGINTESLPVAKLQAFAESYLVSFPVLRGSSDSGQAIGPIPALPTTYIISPAGEAVARNVGPLTRKDLEDFINKQ